MNQIDSYLRMQVWGRVRSILPTYRPIRQEDVVFERIMGLPAHALIIHAAVVFIPLLVLAALAFGLVPALRGRIGWVAVLLAVIAPAAAFAAKESGVALENILRAKGFSAEILAQIEAHAGYGERAFWFSLALGVLVLVHVYVTGNFPRVRAPGSVPAIVNLVLAAVSAVIALITAYYIYKTGDTGAKAVWSGV